MDVHCSSGVYNKAFYLLANKSGWNTETAFQAFARANRDYWTASTDFDPGACGVEQAATDLGCSEADVASALASVGVSVDRSEERRLGKEGVSTCRTGGWADHIKTKKT